MAAASRRRVEIAGGHHKGLALGQVKERKTKRKGTKLLPRLMQLP